MAFLDPVLDPLFQPLMNYSPLLTILILALIISFLISIVYKYMTDQNKMKYLKGRQKEFQKEMKELRSNPEEMMVVQKEAMKVNMEYMKASFKPTLVTMIPIILIFGWMVGSLAYEPIYPGESFLVTAMFDEGIVGNAEIILSKDLSLVKGELKQDIVDGAASWKLKSSEAGLKSFEVSIDDSLESKDVLITKELSYNDPITNYQHSDINTISIDYNKLKPLGTVSILGWQPGWLGIYIIFSLIFSMSIRKMLKLY